MARNAAHIVGRKRSLIQKKEPDFDETPVTLAEILSELTTAQAQRRRLCKVAERQGYPVTAAKEARKARIYGEALRLISEHQQQSET